MSFLDKKLTLNETTYILGSDIDATAAFNPFGGPVRPLRKSISLRDSIEEDEPA